MARDYLTDEQVDMEIDRLNESEAVLLARQEQRLKYRKRQYLYTLRAYEKRGKELIKQGFTYEKLKALADAMPDDVEEE